VTGEEAAKTMEDRSLAYARYYPHGSKNKTIQKTNEDLIEKKAKSNERNKA
jgi:hypothetical protein